MDDVQSVLVRAVLDEQWRERFDADPAAAMAEYELPAAAADALIGGDERVLALLGGASEVPPSPAAEPAADPPPELPPVELVLRLVPELVDNGAGGFAVRYAASLHGSRPPPPETGAAPLDLVVRVSAWAEADGAGGLRLAHAASLDVAGAEPHPSPAPPTGPDVRSAVAAVRAAGREARYDRLVELAKLLEGIP